MHHDVGLEIKVFGGAGYCVQQVDQPIWEEDLNGILGGHRVR